jgi:hypothetical protein
VPGILFVVARDREELWSHLSREFPGPDVRVVVDRRGGDRRQGERRQRAGPPAAGRRQTDRRLQRRVERELASLGYAIVDSQAPETEPLASGSGLYPTAVRQVAAYLTERFRYYTPIPTWDRERRGQLFVLLNGEARPAHRVFVEQGFLDYYGATSPDRIPALLDEWKLASHLEEAGSGLVVVSTYGVEAAGR